MNYDFKINLNEEQEAKDQIAIIKKRCEHMRGDLALEYIKGYLDALREYTQIYSCGISHSQIMFIGYHVFEWLSERLKGK